MKTRHRAVSVQFRSKIVSYSAHALTPQVLTNVYEISEHIFHGVPSYTCALAHFIVFLRRRDSTRSNVGFPSGAFNSQQSLSRGCRNDGRC